MTLWLILIFFFLTGPSVPAEVEAPPSLPSGAVALGLVDMAACFSSKSRGLDAGLPPPNHVLGFLRFLWFGS